MKKVLLIGLALSFGVVAIAQKSIKMPRPYLTNSKMDVVRPALTGNEVIPLQTGNSTVAPVHSSKSVALVIGGSTYDLQTNNSVQHRLVETPTGDLVASWTFGSALTYNGWTERGTAINHYTGGAWDIDPTARVETARTGWGTCVVTDQNEISLAHNSAVTLVMAKSAIGANTWATSNVLPPATDTLNPSGAAMLWPRVVADGQNIHVIANTDPAAATFNGLKGSIVYYNSHDGGATFNGPIALPGLDTNNFLGFRGDEYAIDVNGNNVAIVSGATWQDIFVEISHDGGATWTKKTVLEFPIKKYDVGPGQLYNADSTFRNWTACDGSIDVLIDATGAVHVVFGTITVKDSVSETSGSYTYYPNMEGIAYWNETLDQPYIIAQAADLDSNGYFSPIGTGTDKWGYYFSQATSMPNMGFDAAGNLYVAYSSVVENSDDGTGLSYRNLYAVKSSDGGHSWTKPTNMDSNNYMEEVFPMMNKKVGATMQMICQEDGIPGTSLQDPAGGAAGNPGHPVGVSDIIFLDIPVDSLNTQIQILVPDSGTGVVGIKNNVINNNSSVVVYPNPAKENVTVIINNNEAANATISIANLVGQVIFTTSSKVNIGKNVASINIESLDAGIYFVKTAINGKASTTKLIKE